MLSRTLALLAAFVFVSAARADDADARLKEYLKGITGAEAGRVTPLTGDGMKETFPDHVVFAHVIPQFPLAREAPAPLKHANVIAIPKAKDGQPVLITDTKGLEQFFKASARPVKTNDEAEKAVGAWLRAASELSQDGFFKFTVKAGSVAKADDAITADGVSSVAPQNGDKGEVKAALAFKGGKLTTADTKVSVTAGMRPRCQATKLLDPDPIVRLMAEDSLRVMGSSAAHYLNDQYAKASPQLREAIARVRAKSAAEGR